LHAVVLPLLGSDGLGLFIEEELLCNSSLGVSLLYQVVGTDSFNDSVKWES